MITLEEARQHILEAIPAPEPERLPLAEAHERIVAEAVTAPINLPRFDSSAMDGYAVRAAEVAKASATNPIALKVRCKIVAGEACSEELAPGECARLFTGSALPAGTDAVVMQEDTRTEPNSNGKVLILDAVKPWENVRLLGSDVKCDAVVAQTGEAITAARIALLAALGVTDVIVGKRPRIGLLVTGSELREGGQSLEPGQIYESNRSMLAALVQQAGAVPRVLPLVTDTLADTRSALDHALLACDAVVTCGGASVGEMDFVKAAFKALGGKIEFWQVAVRPGKPVFFGRYRRKLVFGLPGNPVSAFVTFLLLVRPALRLWQGAADLDLPTRAAILSEPLANSGSRRHFMRVLLDERHHVISAGPQGSNALHSLGKANGLVDVPPETTLAPGTTVSVMQLD